MPFMNTLMVPRRARWYGRDSRDERRWQRPATEKRNDDNLDAAREAEASCSRQKGFRTGLNWITEIGEVQGSSLKELVHPYD
jgi:hypothetical protein